jgi:hypothetical protein
MERAFIRGGNLEHLASYGHQSIDAFASRKLEELTRAFEGFRELERRAGRASREKFHTAMDKIPHGPPMPGDEL